MLSRDELNDIRRRHSAKEVIYDPDGDVVGVVVFDADSQSTTADADVAVENTPPRDEDVHRLLEAVEEMQGLIGRLAEVAEEVGPNKYGVYPLAIDGGVLERLKEMAGDE